MQRLQEFNMTINIDKIQLCRQVTKVLGYCISSEGVTPDPDKLSAVHCAKPPTSLKKLRSFLGICNWFRRYVKNYARVAAPLTNLLKDNVRWDWTDECRVAFENLKAALTTPPILAQPDFSKEFAVRTDASGFAIGAVLTQMGMNGPMVIQYASRTLNPLEQKYSATERECLAIIWAVELFRSYLDGSKFTVCIHRC